MKWSLPSINLSLWDWVIIFICVVPAFYLLGTPAIYIWDEAVYANASYAMAHGTSWWIPVHGEYNTKPPLVLWMQALALLIIPSAEWAVRLPSAMAVLGILILFQIALKRWGFDVWTRVLVMVCFVGHEGFIRHHISRTGDLDAVMTFFVVAYSLVVLDAIQQKKWTNHHMLFFFLSVVCAFYAKSIGGWMMLAPLGLVWLLSSIRDVLVTRRFWLGAFLSLGVCLFYYFTRELMQPGFFDLVWHSEYQRMFHNVMPWHEHGAGYYFNNFTILKTFTPWIFLLVGMVIYSLFFLKNKSTQGHLLKWIILGFGYMVVITIPAVKLEWYDAPAYPFFALITGVVAGHFLMLIPSRWKILLIIPIALILWRKMNFIMNDTLPRHAFEYEGFILRQSEVTATTNVFMKVETKEHQLQLDFYRKLIQEEKGIDVPVIDSMSEINVGDEIIISQVDQLEKIREKFSLDTLKSWEGFGYTVKVKGKK